MLAEQDTLFATFHPEDPGCSHGRFDEYESLSHSSTELPNRSTVEAYIFATSALYTPYWNMAASYDPSTGITYAIVHCKDMKRTDEEVDCLDFASGVVFNIKEAAQSYLHPLLPVIAIVDRMTSQNALDATLTLSQLRDVENMTGQRFYIREEPRELDTLALDFPSIVATLNACSTLTTYLEKVADRYIAALTQMFEFIDEIAHVTAVPHTTTHLRGCSAGLKRHARFLLVSNKNALSRLKYDQLGTQTQLNVVYSFIAQRDNKLNIEVARDSKAIAIASKRDSSSMKTLSVLSMVFLPGTFVTAFFAMPLFEWNRSPGGGIATHHLWIYWALTAPLTILVLTTWAIWMRFRIRRHDREDLEAGKMDVYEPNKTNEE